MFAGDKNAKCTRGVAPIRLSTSGNVFSSWCGMCGAAFYMCSIRTSSAFKI